MKLAHGILLLAIAGLHVLAPPSALAADEPMAVVIAEGSRHRIEGLPALTEIYRRKKQYWPDGQHIEPINLPADDPRRLRFSQAVLGMPPDQLDAYWNELYFHGVLPPTVLQSVEAVLRFVSMTPGAIGYVPLCSVDSRVMIALTIDTGGPASERFSPAACKREQQAR